MNRDRFPGAARRLGAARRAAGSQVVDSAIEAMADWMRSGSQANHGGAFKQAHETDELVASTRAALRDAARRRARRASSSARASPR